MTMQKRKIKKAIKRISHLPGGVDLLRYSANKVDHYIKKSGSNLSVAHPATLMLEVTNQCNLHCITCPREYQFGKEMRIGQMDFNLLKNIVDQAYPYMDSIGLTGLGEPLMYMHLYDALAYIKGKNKGIITSLSTNANIAKTVERIDKIKDLIDTIQISVDGIGDVYNRVRIKADYDKFIENVKGIREITLSSDTDITLNMVVIRENYHQMAEMVELTSSLKLNNLSFTLFNIASVTDFEKDYYDLYKSESFKAELRRAKDAAKQYQDIDVEFWDYETKNGFQKCNFPWSHFYVSWDGYIPPCCAKPFPKELHFGDLKQISLMEGLNSPDFKHFRKQWQKNETPEFCKNCHFIDLEPISL